MKRSAATCLAMLGALVPAQTVLAQESAAWVRDEVNWHVTGGGRIKAIHHPSGQSSPAAGEMTADKALASPLRAQAATTGTTMAFAGIIKSPPVAGFTPWIAIVATNANSGALETAAVPESVPTGSYLTGNVQTGYAIGLYDTGAAVSVLGHASAVQMGMYSANMVTTNTTTVTGVTGSVDCFNSKPFGLFIAGLEAIDPVSLLLNSSTLMGESNVSVLVGPVPAAGAPDLATAIGSPMSVFATAVIRNDLPISRTRGGVTYSGPTVRLFDNPFDPGVPEYPNSIPLELRPQPATGVDYYPCIEIWGDECPGGADMPLIPSAVSMFGMAMQSLFFVSEASGVDLYRGTRSSLQNGKFMVDTGAQVTVVGTGIGARLALNPNAPDFQVEVQGVDGQIVMKPGFYIDTIEIPALGDEIALTFNHVPVVLMNIASPEGGNLDGIIGMNLLDQYNLVLQGGGVNDGINPYYDPVLYFQRIAPIADADFDNDEDVDDADEVLLTNCRSGPKIAARSECLPMDVDHDGDVDQDDFGVFQRCYSGSGVTPTWDCGR